jgi:hypothetical protein
MSSNNPTLKFHRTTDAVRISRTPVTTTTINNGTTGEGNNEKLNDYLKRVVNSQYTSQVHQPSNLSSGINIAPVMREGVTTPAGNTTVDRNHVAHGARTNHLSLLNNRYNYSGAQSSNPEARINVNPSTTTHTTTKTLGLKSSQNAS